MRLDEDSVQDDVSESGFKLRLRRKTAFALATCPNDMFSVLIDFVGGPLDNFSVSFASKENMK